ncbi:transcriptional regulator [Sphingomonas sp. 10B4]|uniref:helix-turn-helix domain-containing protein n=1 Tax=Sphingomonas sp. 10B4 TaxID=3048575 RepID=UPI002AB5CA8A|nr:transcriptional regulator [Sphingomonas sp. 10B4]MDY7526297.1 transcriptional regulator [Sphingomonas sp. 10B4]MEB0284307.1 transcriptional regulator [Sphingomonas sp. 10B4]
MNIRPVRTDEDHEAALREIEALWGAEEGTDAGDRLDVLATLVETYESRRWPIETLDPVRAIEAAMEMNGYTRAELAALIGQSRATEILARHRALTLPMIRKIAGAWHVPEKVLVQDYALAKA